jgi:hypothetical protein
VVSNREEWRGGVEGGGGGLKKENRQDNLEMIYVYDVPSPPPSLSVHHRRAKIGQNYRGTATWIVDILKKTVSCIFNL